MKFREFWKTYSREIAKLLTTHFALAIFSILSTSAFLLIQTESTKNLLCVLICILVFVFYYYLVRTQMWNLGARDRLTANGGRMKLNRLTGLYLGLLASVPSLIVNLIYLISYTYRDYAAFQTLHSVFACIELIWDAQAMGLRRRMLISRPPFCLRCSPDSRISSAPTNGACSAIKRPKTNQDEKGIFQERNITRPPFSYI